LKFIVSEKKQQGEGKIVRRNAQTAATSIESETCAGKGSYLTSYDGKQVKEREGKGEKTLKSQRNIEES